MSAVVDAGASVVTGRKPGHRVVVVGAGWAGVAAAVAAREAMSEVVVIDGGTGASGLGPGALDGEGCAEDVAWIAEALGSERLAGERHRAGWALLASTGGRLRPSGGRDAGLLDLGALEPGSRVLVPRVDRAGWDADSLVRLWNAEPAAVGRGMTFEAVEADVARFDDERRIPDPDLALRHDEPARLKWLGEQLRVAVERSRGGRTGKEREPAAFVLGPWLGLAAPRAKQLSELVGLPVGEALAPLATTAGLRFEAGRKALFARLGVKVKHGRVVRVDAPGSAARTGEASSPGRYVGDRWLVSLAMGEPIDADGVVLAIGGLVGGGILYAPPEHGAGPEGTDVVRAPLRASVECGLRVEMRGDVGAGSSLFGPALDADAWPVGDVPGALETVGVRGDGPGAVPGLVVAGDVVANRPRTVGDAVKSGRAAGARCGSSAA